MSSLILRSLRKFQSCPKLIPVTVSFYIYLLIILIKITKKFNANKLLN